MRASARSRTPAISSAGLTVPARRSRSPPQSSPGPDSAARTSRSRWSRRTSRRFPSPTAQTFSTIVHIAREAVTNAVKHGRPDAIEVVLEYPEEWRLRIRDDGRGFDAERARRGFGLRSMRRQAHALGGRLRGRRRSRAPGRRRGDPAVSLAVPPLGAAAVVIADDHPAIRLGVRMALMRGGFAVSAEAGGLRGSGDRGAPRAPRRLPAGRPHARRGHRGRAQDHGVGAGTAIVMLTVSQDATTCSRRCEPGRSATCRRTPVPTASRPRSVGVLKGEAALPRALVGARARSLRGRRRCPPPRPVRVRGRRSSPRGSARS